MKIFQEAHCAIIPFKSFFNVTEYVDDRGLES